MWLKAKNARKIVDKYEEPKNIKEVYKLIKKISELGYSNISFLVPDINTADDTISNLSKNGYEVFSKEGLDKETEVLLDIQWYNS